MRYRSAVGMYMATAVAMVGWWLMGTDSVLAGTPRVKSVQLGTVQGVPAPAPMLRSIEPAEVVGIGGKIRLRGTNLGTAQTAVVVFHPGVIAEQVERHTPNEIVVRVPVGAQTGNIQVVTGVNAAALRSMQTQIGVIEGCETPAIQAQVAQYKTQQIFMLSFGRFSNPIRRFVTAAYMHPKPSIRPVIDEVDGVKLVRNRLIVDLKDFLSFDVALQIADQLNAELVGHFPITNSYVLDLRQTPKHLKELDALMARVAQDQRVAEVWHDIVLELRQVRFADVDVVDRYRHTRDNTRPTFPGNGLHGREDAWATDRIQAPGAWNLIERFIGRNNLSHVKVAVVDSGCDQRHPEFDSNGDGDVNDPDDVQLKKVEIDDWIRVRIAGREVILPQANAFTERPYDLGDNHPVQHGTMVTSLIGARNGNVIDGATGDRGINGLLHNPMPYTIQVYRASDLREGDWTTLTVFLSAINAAAITRARILNASYGQPHPINPDTSLRGFEVRVALRKLAHQLNQFRDRLLLVVAAGNEADAMNDPDGMRGLITPFEDLNLNGRLDAGEDFDGDGVLDHGNYVAASLGTLPNVITVGAIDHYDQRARFSNWGVSVQIAAPGVDVMTAGGVPPTAFTIGGARFNRVSGTSFATPLTAGSAGLLLAIRPQLTPNDVKNYLINTAYEMNTTDGNGNQMMWKTLKTGYAVRQLLVDRGVIGNDQPWTGVSKVVYDGLRMFEIRRGPDGRAQAFADRALFAGHTPSLAHQGHVLIWISNPRSVEEHNFSTGHTSNLARIFSGSFAPGILELRPDYSYLLARLRPPWLGCTEQIDIHLIGRVIATVKYPACRFGWFGRPLDWESYQLYKAALRPDNRRWALDYLYENGTGNRITQSCRVTWDDNPFPAGNNPLFGFPRCIGTEFRYPAWAPEGRAYGGAEGARLLKIEYYDAAHGYQFTRVDNWPHPPILWLNWSPDGSELGVLGGNTLYTVRRDWRDTADRDPRPLQPIGRVVFTWQW
jgi:hypothetical protein